MINPAVSKLVHQWRKIYESDNPLQLLREIDGDFPIELVEEMNQTDFLLPEPFFAPLESDMKNDLLLLLMNPGEVKEQGKYADSINKATFERYVNWERDDFYQECGRLDSQKIPIPKKKKICSPSCILHNLSWDGCRWRRIRYREAKFDVKLSFDLLNTMEYIPYHSKRYNDLSSIQNWMHSANTTKMAFDAVCEIANNHLVKYIVSLGSAWINILHMHGYLPDEDVSIRNSDNNVLGRLLKYQIKDSALPIVIHLYPRAIRLPSRQSVINEMRRMLGEPILKDADPKDTIQSNI